ncbi:hypothetical protein FGF1_26040 [Flavobacteriaceae bacterium GF1]
MDMKRIRIRNLNLKYILGEILLIFIGINLAIWFNNWNTSNEISKNKAVALTKIEGELRNNLGELLKSRADNKRIPEFIAAYKELSSDDSGTVVMTAGEMKVFQSKYSSFYKVLDSIQKGDGLYEYKGDTYINLEIATLSKIAWDTSKATGIFSDFSFDCLYELESTYNLQNLVANEFQKVVEALQRDSIEKLLKALEFVSQLEQQLEKRYNKVLLNLENCK